MILINLFELSGAMGYHIIQIDCILNEGVITQLMEKKFRP